MSEHREVLVACSVKPRAALILMIRNITKTNSWDSRHTYVFTHHILHSVIRELFDLLFNGVGLFELFACQVPTASVTIEGASALNRVRWSSGGKEVAVGDSEGRVWIYDTGEVLELTV